MNNNTRCVNITIPSDDPLISRRWSEVEIEVGIQLYRNFLFINKKYHATFPVLPPSLETDEIWHHHILDTRAYHSDCQQIFGYYFHHYPYFGTRGEQDQENLNLSFETMQALHFKEFGYRIPTLWD